MEMPLWESHSWNLFPPWYSATSTCCPTASDQPNGDYLKALLRWFKSGITNSAILILLENLTNTSKYFRCAQQT